MYAMARVIGLLPILLVLAMQCVPEVFAKVVVRPEDKGTNVISTSLDDCFNTRGPETTLNYKLPGM